MTNVKCIFPHTAHLRFRNILGNAFDDFVLQITIHRAWICILTESHPNIPHNIIIVGPNEQNCRSSAEMPINLASDVLPPG